MVKFWKIGQQKWKMTNNFKKPNSLQKKIKHIKELNTKGLESNHCSNLISNGRVSLNSDLEIEDYAK